MRQDIIDLAYYYNRFKRMTVPATEVLSLINLACQTQTWPVEMREEIEASYNINIDDIVADVQQYIMLLIQKSGVRKD